MSVTFKIRRVVEPDVSRSQHCFLENVAMLFTWCLFIKTYEQSIVDVFEYFAGVFVMHWWF